MECFGSVAIYLWQPEREHIEAQNTTFDTKTAFFMTDVAEMNLKGIIFRKKGCKANVKTHSGKV